MKRTKHLSKTGAACRIGGSCHCLTGLLLALLVLGGPADLAAQPVEAKYKKYFFHFQDNRSISEKALNLVGLTGQDVGRSVALIAGVYHYPNLADNLLTPAAIDMGKMKSYLKDYEFFDEIIVLENEAVTLANLQYFFQDYIPRRVATPKSRFLFAYSGHGMESGGKGYLLTSQARNLQDRGRSINLATVKVFVDEVVRDAHHTLVLLNACYGGAFLRRAFGDHSWIPRHPGAHAITAGAARELTWASGGLGKGSDFFEKLFAGLDGRADTQPIARAGRPAGDGLVTAAELFAYIKTEIQLLSDQRQNPQMGDISEDQSLGGFFFLNRRRQVEGGVVPEWKPTIRMGAPRELPPTFTEPLTGMPFGLIREGAFQMGSTDGGGDEKPVHTVRISQPFYMGKHEVTQGQWKAVMGTEPWKGESYVREGDDYPTVYVSWDDAQAFIERLNARDSSSRYRLPTEAEWEYAARAGSTTTYSFGDNEADLGEYAWNDKNAWDVEEKYAHRVGQKIPNVFGLYDMHGNVWEWVEDWYGSGYYQDILATDPKGPQTGSNRVIRGGGWYITAGGSRSANRDYFAPGLRDIILGFRLVRTAL